MTKDNTIKQLIKELDNLQKAVIEHMGWEPCPVGATKLGEAVISARELLNKVRVK